MESNRFEKFAVFGLLYINLGRPQDVLPMVKAIHPGIIWGVLVLYSLIRAGETSQIFNDRNFQEKKWFIALWIMMVVSTITSIYLRVSIEFIFEYLKVVVLFLGLMAVLEKERDFTLLANIFLISVLTLCIPIVLKGIDSDRASIGTFYDPNDMAMFVSCAIPYLLFLLHNNTFKVKFLALMAIAFGMITVIATQSRMGFLALVLNGLFYLVSNISFQPNALRKLVIVSGVFIVFVIFAGNIYWDRIKTTIESGQTGSGRTLIWERSLQIVSEYPVFGAGPGTFMSAYGRMLKNGKFETVGNVYDIAWKAAHNSYLIVAAELGVAGFVFFMMIIRTSLGQLCKVRRHCSRQKDKIHILVMSNVTVSSLLIFLFCAIFLSHAYSSLFVTLVACSILVRKINIQEGQLIPNDEGRE